MDRKKFFVACGLGAVGILGAGELFGCGRGENPVAPPKDVDFALDLDAPENAELKKKGGYIIRSGVIIAHTLLDAYVAVSSACTHLGTSIDYRLSEDCFVCLAHHSEFNTDGTIRTGPARIPLVRYNTILRGKSLRVFY